MSSLSKMLSILDMFTVETPTWSTEAVCSHIGCSVPTGYRYLRELVGAGLLLRLGDGSYSLGPRIIKLDYQLRTVDPLYRIGQPLMHALAEQTGCDCVMTRIFDDEIIDTHRESGQDGPRLAYGRGRPRPLFLGSAPKVMLATMPKGKLTKLYNKHTAAIAEAGMGRSAEEFIGGLQKTRKAGHYISRGELEADIGAIAVPILGESGLAVGALAFVSQLRRFEFMNHDKLLELLREAASRISNEAAQSHVTQ